MYLHNPLTFFMVENPACQFKINALSIAHIFYNQEA